MSLESIESLDKIVLGRSFCVRRSYNTLDLPKY